MSNLTILLNRVNLKQLGCLFLFLLFIPGEYAVAKNKKNPGPIVFILGHDTPTLTDYRQTVLDKHPEFPTPDGVTLYTNLVEGVFLAGLGADPYDEYGELMPGFNLDTNWQYNFGNNIHNFSQTLSEYPNASLAIGLYISDAFADCANRPVRTINGIFNQEVPLDDIAPESINAMENAIDTLITHLKSLDRTVYLRIGYEFDSKDMCYEKTWYVPAFRYIKERIDYHDASNIYTVWQAAGWPRDEYIEHLDLQYLISDPEHYYQWYPGNEYVDFVGLSTFYMQDYQDFQWSCSHLNPDFFTETVAPRYLHEKILDFAREHDKPVMIAEAAPQGVDTRDLSVSCIFNNNKTYYSANDIWNLWYKDFFKFIKQNRDVIEVVHYINSNWQNDTTIFSCEPGGVAGAANCPSGYWGSHGIQDNEWLLEKFFKALNKL